MSRGRAALALAAVALAATAFPQHQPPASGQPPAGAPPGAYVHAAPLPGPAVVHPDEKHLRNLRQLTFSGENAEGYWSPDGKLISYQRRDPDAGIACDQEFVVDVATGKSRRVSDGRGRVTCGYLYDGGKRILYATTGLADAACPPPSDMSKGYVWPMYAAYDVVSHALDGSAPKRLTDTPGYDAEATVSPDGKKIVFTSTRDGDPELYSMNMDGSGVMRLTHEPGYDGGAFYSPDGRSSASARAGPERGRIRRITGSLLVRGARPSDRARDLRHERGRIRHAPDHLERRSELLPVLPSRRRKGDLPRATPAIRRGGTSISI